MTNMAKIMLSKLFTIIIFSALIFNSIGCMETKKPIRIAISKASGSDSYLNYSKFIKHADETVEIVDFYKMSPEKALEELKTCSGLVLSGGPDAHPARFGRPEDTSLCSIDLERDTLEFDIIKYALDHKIPILGICRGEQLMNIALGGDLIVDIPYNFEKLGKKTDIAHQTSDKKDAKHKINVRENSILYKIAGSTSGEVNSNHHQAVGKLSNDLFASAYTQDGTIEAIEWNSAEGKSWFIGVQWHPERLDKDNKFCTPLAVEFVKQAYKFAKERK